MMMMPTMVRILAMVTIAMMTTMLTMMIIIVTKWD